MPTPKLIATDLDGTFLSPDQSVSAVNSAAVLAAQQAGIPVVFATGRPIRWLEVVKGLPGAHPTVIASNGAAMYDLATEVVLDRITIDPDSALDSVGLIREAIPGAAFAFESGTRFGHEQHYTTWEPNDGSDPDIFTGPLEALIHADLVKVLVQSKVLRSDELRSLVEQTIGDRLSVTNSATRGYGLVELAAPGVGKGEMLARFCHQLGIDAADVAAFGDMPNDLSMLTWVGQPYVVANADPALLSRGFSTVPPNTESGVGQTIRRLLG